MTMIEDPATLTVGSLGPVEVFAAGGVVWRPRRSAGKKVDGAGKVEVLLVHRPRYDDWSIPKGKRDPGESDEDCAHREVLEETGLSCELGTEVAQSEYIDRKGRAKLVRYWAMRAPIGAAEFRANDEVDQLRWLPPRRASKLASYAADALIIQAFGQAR